ncbi:copper resistance protein CopC [Micromonospora sp. NPDC006431]|uniref:copper resistance CopC family protein n=1 Tax=Micromonospora sp. NPDC006431 TaxID=3364235 RepID=UPI0036AD24A1
MRRLPPAPGRAASGLLACVLVSAVAVLGFASPAAAHGTLAMSTPAEGVTVNEPLAAVQLYFTERVADNAYFTITAPGGGRVDNGWNHGSPKPLDKPVREYFLVAGKFEPREYSTGFPAVVTLAHLPAAGQYSVSYLSVASDGEPVRGTMSFRYTGRVTAAAPGWRPPTSQPDPSLVAAAEQHASSGHGSGHSSAAPAALPVPSTPPAAPSLSASPPAVAAPSTAQDDEGGLGWVAWTGWAVAVAAAVAGIVNWRRRPAPVGRASGRDRSSGAAARRQSAGPRSKGRTGAAGRAGANGTAAASGSGGKRRRAAAPATRKNGAVGIAVTAPSAAGQEATSASAVATARPVTAGRVGASDMADPALTLGRWLSNTRSALLVAGLVVALLAGFGIGRIGTGDARTPTGAPTLTTTAGGPPAVQRALVAGDGHQHAPGTGAHSHPGDGSAGQTQATGTTVSAGGYTLQPMRRSQPAGVSVDYRFRIVGADRQAATRFTVVHDKPLHLIVVGRDLSGYQHLHPTMAPDGTWSVPLKLARAGGYRVYADFSLTGTDGGPLPLVLGVDHDVPGAYTPAALPPVQPQAMAGPFTVSMDGTPTVGVAAPMLFRVSRTGTPGPVQLQRYLGAYGHLVVVREGDLGYVHVHPEQELVDGAVKVWLTAPSMGRYRAFFDFQVDGKVHTAQYTINLA